MMARIREESGGDLPRWAGHAKEAATCVVLAMKTVAELLAIFHHEP